MKAYRNIIGLFSLKGVNMAIGFDQGIGKEYLVRLVGKTETLISRKIRFVIFSPGEFEEYRINMSGSEILMIWKAEG